MRWILDLERGPEAFDRLVRAMGRPVVHELTRREWQVLDAAAAGLTRHETAELLGIGFETVKTFRRHAQAKLDATNITHAVAIAIRRGLLL